MIYYYIVERLAENGKWYRTNTYDHLTTAMEMANHFTKKDGEKYRVLEMQCYMIVEIAKNKA